MDDSVLVEGELNRKRAVLAVLPFLFLGLSCLGLILAWGLNPIWGFLILPPILFICVLAYVAFRTGFAQDRTGDVNADPEQR
jgi:4-hydroxybenzoate polyprenyltransferase